MKHDNVTRSRNTLPKPNFAGFRPVISIPFFDGNDDDDDEKHKKLRRKNKGKKKTPIKKTRHNLVFRLCQMLKLVTTEGGGLEALESSRRETTVFEPSPPSTSSPAPAAVDDKKGKQN
ncbi:hypothetical protein I7I52_01729 [Histoplasma capsulatum]|uniref:Uncharacterized protein n=1 Tax=Ajellomyces capsulatus TaxID=5037 RepID=A0A8H7Z4E4_AJECA|nr:hypothetical protein I7I52_01729 [Histoplasma capsulatum]